MSDPRELPIRFSGPEVRAILDGRKVETRRPVRPQPPRMARVPRVWVDGWTVAGHEYHCPYGEPGDLLYVRETWASAAAVDDLSPRQIGEQALDAGYLHPWAPVWYDADGEYNHATVLAWDPDVWGGRGKLRPSIHMPKWAARIWLRVTEVRVERVRDITVPAITSEGVRWGSDDDPTHLFSELWDAIYAGRSLGWADNPWVWVIRYEVVSTTGRPAHAHATG